MKVYELINALAKYPAGKDIIIANGEKSFIPIEITDADNEDLDLSVVIFAKLDK